MKNTSIKELENIASDLRKKAITMIYEAQSGHPGGALSVADYVAACYFREMNIDPKNPQWPDRDRFVLSKGHVCPIQYAALGTLGYFPESDLHTLRKEGSKLQGHPDMKNAPASIFLRGLLGKDWLVRSEWPLPARMIIKTIGFLLQSAMGNAKKGKFGKPAKLPISMN